MLGGMDILVEAPNLLRRYQNGDAFRRHHRFRRSAASTRWSPV